MPGAGRHFWRSRLPRKVMGAGVHFGKVEEEVGGVQTGHMEERAEHVVGGVGGGEGGVSGLVMMMG